MNSNKTITCAVLAVLSVLLFSERNCLADIENQIRSSSSSGDAGWGQGKMKVSERYYYEGRFRIIMDRWRDIAWNSKTDREGRLVQPHHAYLHIDLDKEAIWIEDQGKVRQEDYMELPSHMKWELHHLTEHAKTRLPASVCLKNRGKYTSRLFREIIYLIGNGRGGDHLDFRIESANSNSDYGGGPGPAITLLPKSNKKQEKEPYGSILVSEEEYAEYVEKRAPDTNGSRLQDNDKDVGRWSSTQKRIYQQIEVEIGKRDYELRKIEHNRAIDYSAMLAKVNCKRKDRSWDFLPLRRSRVTGPYNMDFLVKADHLGQGVWYAKSYPYMHGTGQTDFLEMDFIVHGTAKMSKRVYKDWIAKGQSKHNVSLDSKSEWSVALADGTRVEFVGVKRGSVVGGQCWGPDGSLLNNIS